MTQTVQNNGVLVDEVFTCYFCSNEFKVSEKIVTESGDECCEDCYNEEYTSCESCESEIGRDDAYNGLQDETLCSVCFYDRYANCESCSETFSLNDMRTDDNGYSYCEACFEDIENENETTPQYNDENETPKDLRASITSDRTFGIEFEMYNGNIGKIKNAVGTLGFKSSGDGSIDGNNAIEVQTSVLKKGDEILVRKLTEKAKDFGFRVNDSCGTHIHLGGSDFVDKTRFELCDILQAREGFAIAVETVLYKSMCTSIGTERAYRKLFVELPIGTGNINDMLNYSSYYKMTNGKISRYSVTTLTISEYGHKVFFVCRDSTLAKMKTDVSELNDEKKILFVGHNRHNDAERFIDIGIKNVIFFKKENTEKYNKLVALLKVYKKYHDFFMALLPENRRDNSYCRDLAVSYSDKDIQGLHSQYDIEKMWYKKATIAEVEQSKQEHYNNSRYHAVNLHSLFGTLGTVEIRSHNGTLNAESILFWVKLHQFVLDSVAKGIVRNVDLATKRESVATLAKDFIKRFELKDDLLAFVEYRLKVNSGIVLNDIINNNNNK